MFLKADDYLITHDVSRLKARSPCSCLSRLIHTDTRCDKMIQDESSYIILKKGMLKKFY